METQQIMEQKSAKLHPGFFFLSLGILISLITSVVFFLNLIFSTLDKRFPDVLNATYQYGYSTYDYEEMRVALATLIIFFPVFVLISFFWERFVARGALGSIDNVIRKWVMYIVLFLSALLSIIDLVTLVKYFVSGEVTERFMLKVVSVLVVAVLVGFYYILLIKKKDSVKKINFIFGILGIVLVAVAISTSFMVMGSPAQQRMLRLDDRRVQDLQNIQAQLINYWQQKEKLPEKLSELSNPLSGYSLPVDPEFEKGLIYEYSIKDKNKLTFELCATFALPMPKGWNEYTKNGVVPMMDTNVARDVASTYPYPGGGINESWDHPAGRVCYTRTIDKEMYPTFVKNK